MLGLLRRCSLAGSNGPHRLIGNGHKRGLLSINASKGGFHLVADELRGIPRLPQGKAFTHADDGIHTSVRQGNHFPIHVHVRLSKHGPALGVTHNTPGAPHILKHGNGNLSRIGARGLPMDVLGSNLNERLVEIKDRKDTPQVNGGRKQHHINLIP